jgi:hypothetical protein
MLLIIINLKKKINNWDYISNRFCIRFQASDGEKSDQDLVVDDGIEVSKYCDKICSLICFFYDTKAIKEWTFIFTPINLNHWHVNISSHIIYLHGNKQINPLFLLIHLSFEKI